MEPQLSSAIDAALEVIADSIRDVNGSRSWNVHLLIDPTIADPMPEFKCGERERTRISIDQRLMSEMHQPYLVPVREVGRDPLIEIALELSMREVEGHSSVPAGARSVCAFVACRASTNEMARSLARNAVVFLKGERRLFRFWDPRVMDLLPHFVSTDEFSCLAAPAERWCWISRDGKAETLELDEGLHSIRQAHALDPKRFLNFGLINQVMDALNLDSTSFRATDFTQIDRAIQEGQERWNLQSDYEKVSYALHRQLIGENFDDESQVRLHMEGAVRDGKSPIAALESFDEQFWATRAGRQGL